MVRNWRLIPPEYGLGWTPYLWLAYLAFLFVEPLLAHAPRAEWLQIAVAVAVFLPLYFAGFWADGWPLFGIIAAIFAIGASLSVHNGGASCFFIFASAYIGRLRTPAFAYRFLAGYIIAIVAAGWYWHFELGGLIAATLFSAMLGATTIRQIEVKRADTDLRLARHEVERLAKVAERERIARDLHDVLGHTLSVIVLKSELASKLADRDPARAAKEIRDVESVARDALAELRGAIAGYRSLGIDVELRRACDVLETAGVNVNYEATPLRLPPIHEGVLALAIREAVTNVVRHAHARSVSVSLVEHDGMCRFEIADDGDGGRSVEGNGLAGMRERVEALGGTLVRDGTGGTRLAITLPLAGASS